VRSVTGLFVVQVLILKIIRTNQLSFPMTGDRIVARLIPSARESYFVTVSEIQQGFSGAHLVVARTLGRVKQRCWRPGLKRLVSDFVRTC
jgi:hypothetical protein